MPSEGIKIFEFNHYQKSDKAQIIIFVDLDCLTENNNGCKKHGNSSITKVGKHNPSSFSLSA